MVSTTFYFTAESGTADPASFKNQFPNFPRSLLVH